MFRRFHGLKIIFLSALIAMLFTNVVSAANPAGIPPWPIIYSGPVTVDGEPVEDGLKIVGIMEGGFYSIATLTKDGRIAGLTVGPPDSSYFGKTINFQLEGSVLALEEDTFKNYAQPILSSPFPLNFPAIPEPTPTPVATPVTVIPIPVIEPDLSTVAQTEKIGPIIYSGHVILSGGGDIEDYNIKAKIAGQSFSFPSVIDSDFKYHNLVVDIEGDDFEYDGSEILFYLNGPGISPPDSLVARTKDTYIAPESVISILDLVFVPISPIVFTEPAVIVEATVIVPAASLPVTPVTPEPTIDLNNVLVPQAGLNSTTVEPVKAAAVFTDPISEVQEPVESRDKQMSGSFCAKPSVITNPLTGAANVLSMVGPLVLFGLYRGSRRFW
jgi:hypothetical protein